MTWHITKQTGTKLCGKTAAWGVSALCVVDLVNIKFKQEVPFLCLSTSVRSTCQCHLQHLHQQLRIHHGNNHGKTFLYMYLNKNKSGLD